MHVNNIKLTNYRNYNCADVTFSKGVNVIYGNNAQGKTNILESMYLIATGRSHRTNKDKELIKFGNDYANIKIKFSNESRLNLGEMILSQNQKKRIKINSLPINRLSELMGFFNVVMFAPNDLDLIKEGPSHRRKFFDICISQIRPTYFYNLQQYVKILEQRNALLKSINKKNISKNKTSLIDTLNIWNDKLSEHGAAVMMDRQSFIKNIKVYAKEVHLNITQGTEKLYIEYFPSIKFNRDKNKEYSLIDIRKEFKKVLTESNEKDIYNGITSSGPHRDDIIFKLNDNNVKSYGSQGQQRTVVFSLKMAEMELMKNCLGEYPILLLDDIMSELDMERQNYIIKNIEDKQVIITCTNIDNLNIGKKVSLFKVKNGTICRGG